MTLWVCLLIGAAALSFFIGYKSCSAKIQTINEDVERKNKELENKCRSWNDKINKLEHDYELSVQKQREEAIVRLNQINEDIVNAEVAKEQRVEAINSSIEDIRKSKFSTINRKAFEFRQLMFDRIAEESDAAADEAFSEVRDLQREKERLTKELVEFQDSRDAFIAMKQREEQMALEKEFYKIQLSDQNKEDIGLLLSIEKHLNNKEALYKLIWSTFYMKPTKDMLNRVIGTNKTSGIYKITNQLNGKVYIGQSVDLHTRLTNHIKASLGITGNIAHQLVHDVMKENGLDNFTFEVVEKCEKEQLNKKEKLWIETCSSDTYGYNKTTGGAVERSEH